MNDCALIAIVLTMCLQHQVHWTNLESIIKIMTNLEKALGSKYAALESKTATSERNRLLVELEDTATKKPASPDLSVSLSHCRTLSLPYRVLTSVYRQDVVIQSIEELTTDHI